MLIFEVHFLRRVVSLIDKLISESLSLLCQNGLDLIIRLAAILTQLLAHREHFRFYLPFLLVVNQLCIGRLGQRLWRFLLHS